MKAFTRSLFALLVSPAAVFGKAAYFNEAQLVARADAIAIIRLAEPEKSEAKGKVWHYRQKADAKVLEAISGALPEDFVLHGSESFICARCPLAEGTYLAFLSKDGEFWAGTNWHLSLRPVREDGQIEWFENSGQSFPVVFQDAGMVKTRVRTLAGKPDLSVGRMFPLIPLPVVGGASSDKLVSLSDLKGQRTVVHIFAGW